MAKAKTYRVNAQQIIAHPRVWQKGDTLTSDELDPQAIKHHLAYDPPLLTEVTEETAPEAAPGG